MQKISLKKLLTLKYFFILFYLFLYPQIVFSDGYFKILKRNSEINNKNKLANLKWEISKDYLENNDSNEQKWEFFNEVLEEEKEFTTFKDRKINSLNRSIVFNNERIGPDISWIIPPGFSWNKKYKFDLNARGHNTMIPDPPNRKFFGWNDGDAVGLISYQFLHKEKTSLGINIGLRSLYQGDKAVGGSSNIGEGLSGGFRWDYAISDTSGIAIGAEQLIHFDNLTDTGRNLYITASKGWWDSEFNGVGIFPLYVATAGFGTGRMAVGSKVKGLCSNFLGDDGTDINNENRMCWAPVFSLASVWNEKFSTFFEYNNRFFLLGSSLAPFQKMPVRGSFALILSDHIDDYKVHNLEEINWVFNLSLGF